MPKKQIDFQAGSHVAEDWHDFINSHFGPQKIERLERLGGRLTVSLTVPMVPKERRSNAPTVDDAEISLLRDMSGDKEGLSNRLNLYDIKNLRIVCERLGIAISKKTPRIELIGEITRSLTNGAMWDGILGHQTLSSR